MKERREFITVLWPLMSTIRGNYLLSTKVLVTMQGWRAIQVATMVMRYISVTLFSLAR